MEAHMKKLILSVLFLPIALHGATEDSTKKKETQKQTTRATIEGVAVGALTGYLAACTDGYWPINWFATNTLRRSFAQALAEDRDADKKTVSDAAYAADWIAYILAHLHTRVIQIRNPRIGYAFIVPLLNSWHFTLQVEE